ncbi:MAG TPA: hypothetical protein VLJ68_11505 [Chitinophagaceae bacterium]|nr:hypothetical protein [Chitinophagaceae bacterium]
MLKLTPLIVLLFSSQLLAQSPYLNIEVKMDHYMSEQANYRISMKICDPVKMTEKGDLFTKDTSDIDYLQLTNADFNCGDYNYIEGKDDYAGAGISATPSTTAIFRTPLNFALFPDQEWHWAIVRAKGIAPAEKDAVVPATSTASPTGSADHSGSMEVHAPASGPVAVETPRSQR